MQNIDYKQIDSLEKALIAEGYSSSFVPDVSMYNPKIQEHKIHQFNLETIVAAINGNWEPDWFNFNQRKYYCWWIGLPGRVWSLHDVVCGGDRACVATSLVFETEEQARFAAKVFLKYFELYYKK